MFKRMLTALTLLIPGCDSRVIRVTPPPPTGAAAQGIYTHTLHDVHGGLASLADRAGKVTLIVNVASHCGYTPQYRDLQQLHDAYSDQGFAVIGFPCNDFGGQEPGDASAITACAAGHGASFSLMQKVVVLETEGQSPVYRDLALATGALPRWNFGKYLIGRDGVPIAYYGSSVGPMDATITDALEAALQSN
jgi:glutathione peroxidase